jgi:hypothetical protein
MSCLPRENVQPLVLSLPGFRASRVGVSAHKPGKPYLSCRNLLSGTTISMQCDLQPVRTREQGACLPLAT